MHKHLAPAARLLAAIVIAAPALADGIYNEALSGDTSDDRLAPTLFPLTVGSNQVIGRFGLGAQLEVPDLDYLTITIPPGHELDRFNLVSADVGGAVSFVGMQRGPQITVPYTTFDASPLLGWTHFGSGSVGTDLLPEIGAGSGAMGFTPPLPAGVYTLWIMELDTSAEHSYGFDLHVTALPVCRPDFNGSGDLTVQDIFDFLAAYFSNDPRADFNGSGGVLSVQDIFDFLASYFAGC